MAKERRPCPHCGEAIMRSATVCRFCGRDVPQLAEKRSGVPMPLVIVGLLVLIGVGIALGNNTRGGPREVTLAEAMCADLSDGFSMFQMHSQAVEHYRDGRSEDAAQLAAAKLEDRATRVYCPEFRNAFEATITYEQWIAPDK